MPPALTKAAAAVKDVFSRVDWMKVAKRAGGLAMTAFTGIPTPDQIEAVVGSLEALVADPAKTATKEPGSPIQAIRPSGPFQSRARFA